MFGILDKEYNELFKLRSKDLNNMAIMTHGDKIHVKTKKIDLNRLQVIHVMKLNKRNIVKLYRGIDPNGDVFWTYVHHKKRLFKWGLGEIGLEVTRANWSDLILYKKYTIWYDMGICLRMYAESSNMFDYMVENDIKDRDNSFDSFNLHN